MALSGKEGLVKRKTDGKKEIVYTEAMEQKVVVSWWRDYAMTHGIDERLLLHPANEGNRSRAFAHQLQLLGLRAGTPDLFLAVARQGYHGLWLEMKRANGGKVSQAQEEMLDLLDIAGYRAEVCRGATEAIAIITAYLAGDDIDALHGRRAVEGLPLFARTD